MPDKEEIKHQQELLVLHRRTLAQYLVQQARLGVAYTTPDVVQRIQEARDNIQRIKKILHAWRIRVEDYPDDESPDAVTGKPISSWEPRSICWRGVS